MMYASAICRLCRRAFVALQGLPTQKHLSVFWSNTNGDHTETIQIRYDPNVSSYQFLLDMFWANHDPTAMNKRQYMSAIFYHDDEQRALAELTRNEKQKSSNRKIQTQILPFEKFYDAEDYHQKYLLRRHASILRGLRLNDEEVKSSTIAARLTGYLNGEGNLNQLEEEMKSWGLSGSLESSIRDLASQKDCAGVACSKK